MRWGGGGGGGGEEGGGGWLIDDKRAGGGLIGSWHPPGSPPPLLHQGLYDKILLNIYFMQFKTLIAISLLNVSENLISNLLFLWPSFK